VLAASSLREFELHKPVISAINGACFAAGFEMMLGTDIRVAAHHATFALPEVKRAVIPFAGSIVRLPRQISYCQAMEFLLTGESMTAEKAVTIGLVNYAVPAAEVMGKAIQIAQRIALNGPLAVQRVKQTAIQASGMTLSAGYRLEDESKRIVFESDDAKEGPLAFMQKRSPIYSGR
jgi:enoyl-CoA hydratase